MTKKKFILFYFIFYFNFSQTHKNISLKLSSKFARFHQNWLDKETTKEQHAECDDWFLGKIYIEDDEKMLSDNENSNNSHNNEATKIKKEKNTTKEKTSKEKITSIRIIIDEANKAPYRPYCKYSISKVNL